MKNSKRHMRNFVNYIRRTYKAKLSALTLMGLGFLSSFVSEDGTFLVFTLMIGVPIFFLIEDDD